MGSFVLLFSLLLTLTATAASTVDINFTTFKAPAISTPSATPPTPLPSFSVHPQPPPTHLQETPQPPQLNYIIDSIVGAGDFSNWATLLAQADPSIFPLSATFLVPEDAAFLAGNATPNAFDPLLFLYHVVPRRFTFSELRLFPSGARLPTLLPGKTLLVTNNSAGNFTLNGAPFTHPDLFQNSVVSVHGIGSVLDYYNSVGEVASSPEKSPGSVALPGSSLDWISWNLSSGNSSDSVPSPPPQEFKQVGNWPVMGLPKIVASSSAKGAKALLVVVLWLSYSILLDGYANSEFETLGLVLNVILILTGCFITLNRFF